MGCAHRAAYRRRRHGPNPGRTLDDHDLLAIQCRHEALDRDGREGLAGAQDLLEDEALDRQPGIELAKLDLLLDAQERVEPAVELGRVVIGSLAESLLILTSLSKTSTSSAVRHS